MFPIFDLLPLILKSFFSVFQEKLFWIFIIIVVLLYRKMAMMSRYLFKTPGENPWRLILLSLFFGIMGGFVGSVLLVFIGISVNKIGGLYLFFTALGLMLIQQRFLCFAYAGGVLSLFYLFFGFPQISVPQVMALVAVLHLVEAVLIYLTGSICPLPVYVRNKEGRVVGGYNLQKFWPLPLVVFFVGVYPEPEVVKGLISMPDWWPLLKPELGVRGGELVYSMLGIPAVLGYGDIAMTTIPRVKTRRAAWELAGYSVLLLGLAVAAGYVAPLAYAAALFGPLGHEAIIYLGYKREMSGKPFYVPVEKGLKLLHVRRGSPLAKAGVRAGDIFVTVNGLPVHDEGELREAILAGTSATSHKLEYVSGEHTSGEHTSGEHTSGEQVPGEQSFGEQSFGEWEEIRQTVVKCKEGEAWGHIPVPDWYTSKYLHISASASLLKRWWKKITG